MPLLRMVMRKVPGSVKMVPPPLELTAGAPLLNYRPDLSVYDELTGGAAR